MIDDGELRSEIGAAHTRHEFARHASKEGTVGQKILLVDGDQTISETVNDMLKNSGHQTRIETSGGGLDVFSRNPGVQQNKASLRSVRTGLRRKAADEIHGLKLCL